MDIAIISSLKSLDLLKLDNIVTDPMIKTTISYIDGFINY